LRKARTRRGWSLREVERRTGIANAYLSQVERGTIRKPDGAVLWQLSDLYGLDFALLAIWSGHTPRETTASTMSAALRALASLDPQEQQDLIGLLLDRAAHSSGATPSLATLKSGGDGLLFTEEDPRFDPSGAPSPTNGAGEATTRRRTTSPNAKRADPGVPAAKPGTRSALGQRDPTKKSSKKK
jgi:transcriptional regulator with XRE-family HTH domain